MKRPVPQPNPNQSDWPKNLPEHIRKALSTDEVYAEVVEPATDWFNARIEELYEKTQIPTLQWLIESASEDSTLSSLSPEVRMALHLIACDAYHYVFGKGASELTAEEDFILSIWRSLISIGYALRKDEENGRFKASRKSGE